MQRHRVIAKCIKSRQTPTRSRKASIAVRSERAAGNQIGDAHEQNRKWPVLGSILQLWLQTFSKRSQLARYLLHNTGSAEEIEAFRQAALERYVEPPRAHRHLTRQCRGQ